MILLRNIPTVIALVTKTKIVADVTIAITGMTVVIGDVVTVVTVA